MKIEYDKEVDALYIRLVETKIARTDEFTEGINFDFDEKGRLVGIEILNATEIYMPDELFTVSTESLALLDR